MVDANNIDYYNNLFFLNPTNDVDVENRFLKEEILRRIVPEKRCLDFGCGTGYWTSVCRELSCHYICGVDVSESLVKYCCSTGENEFFKIGDDGTVPLRKKTFDVIIVAWVLQEVLGEDQFGKIVNEIGRLLVPQGLVVFADNVFNSSRNILKKDSYGCLCYHCSDHSLLRLFPKNTLQEVLPNGFKLLENHIVHDSFFEVYSVS